MKKILNLLLVLFPIVAISQTPTENHIKTTTYKVESTSSITNPSGTQANQEITYFDGFGRPIQKIAHQQSGTGKDIVTPIEYDGFGRQIKEYFPYVPTSAASLNYKTTALTDVGTFYNTAIYENTLNPFSEKEFEASPLNRVLKQAAPGEDWKLGNAHEIRFDYQTNTNADQVRRFGVSFIGGNTENPYLEDEGIYAPSQLYKTVTKDENWQTNQTYSNDHATEEFKDKQGRIVLKRTFDAEKWHDTYYVYDDYGNLTYILPPKILTYSNLGQVFQNQEIFMDNDNDGVSLLEDGSYYHEISMYISNGKLECYFYGENFQSENLRGGKIADLNFTPDLPNMNLGAIFMYNSDGYSKYAGYAYIENGDLYFEAEYGLFSSHQRGDYSSHFSINLDNWQTNFTIPSLDRNTFNDLIYQYKYDKRNRLIEKKLPGKDWEYIVYDKLDRPVLTQDANLRVQNKWLFTKYDAFSRPVYTGVYSESRSRALVQQTVDTQTTLFETKQGVNTINNTTVYYSNNAFPQTGIDLFTISYYDNYSFDVNGGVSENSGSVTPSTATKSLATGSKIRVLGTSSWITNVIYYDDKGRPIYNYSKNDFLAVTQKVKNELDFVGKPVKTTTTHTKNGTTTTLVDTFTYDHADRLKKQTQSINGATPEVIAENTYDELGQLISKGVGNKEGNARLQTVDYSYNIRGWLKGINDSSTANNAITLAGGDLFGFKINYNNPSTGTALYNGNISQTYWKAQGLDTALKNYTYSYDALNRLSLAVSQDSGRYNESLTYDKNGNILSLLRNGYTNSGATNLGIMDNLSYTYDGGNKLFKVKDTSGSTEGFNDGADSSQEYGYDANGNMISDSNKAITAISYNHLNLPVDITISGSTIHYDYDATGVKQRKTVSGITTD